MQGIGSTVTSESWTKRDGMGYSQEAQTFKDIHEDSLSSDSMSEEFPLLVASLPSRTEIHSEEIHTSCEEDTVQRQDDEYQPHSKRSRRVRRAPKKFTPNSSKNKVYCYCQKEDSGWYLSCDFAYPGCLQYYHAKCVGLEKLTERESAQKYSNCADGTSYACPTCFKIIEIRNVQKDEGHMEPLAPHLNSECKERMASAVKGEDHDIKTCNLDGSYIRQSEVKTDDEGNPEKTSQEYGSNKDSPLIFNYNNEIFHTPAQELRSEEVIQEMENADYSDSDNGVIKVDETTYEETRDSALSDTNMSVTVKDENNESVSILENTHLDDLIYSNSESVRNDETNTATAKQERSNKISENETCGSALPDEHLTTNEKEEINECVSFLQNIDSDDWTISDCEYVHNEETDTATAKQQGSKSLPVSEETLKTLMDCPKLTTNTFFMAHIPNKTSFRLTYDEWKQIEPTSDKPDRLQPCWTSVLAHRLSESNDYCTFKFKRHFIQRQNSRKRHCDIFKSSGNCVFTNCTCSFKLSMNRTQFTEKEISVNYTGQVKHATGERQSRFIQNSERATLAAKFKETRCKPSKVYQERKDHLTSDAKASGNRTGCGVQPTTIRKIASESRQNEYISKDLVESLLAIRQLFIEKENSRNKPPSKIQGFIHTISVHPLTVCMWSEGQVRLWHDRVLHDVAYLDATGTIVGNYNGKRSLYYALAVRHPTIGNPPIPVAEMITNDHSAMNIRAFLEKFKRDDGKVFGKDVIPRQVTTDYSKAIILAILREFNNESLLLFFNRAHRLLRREGTEEDLKLTTPHVGCSHFMHIVHKNLSAIRRLKKSTSSNNSNHGDVWYRFNMYCMSLLVNASTLEEFNIILKDITVCLMSKYLVDKVQDSYKNITGRVEKMGKCKIDDVINHAGEFDGTIAKDTTRDNCVSPLKNPFENHFENLLNPIIAEVDIDNKGRTGCCVKNRSWCPEFLSFIRSYICEMPLWSGVLLGSLDRYSKTGCSTSHEKKDQSKEAFLSYKSANAKSEGYIEGVMRQLKQEDFPGKKRMRADAFALENYERIRRRLTDFGDRIHTALNPRPKRLYRKQKPIKEDLNSSTEKKSKVTGCDDYNTVEETWGKRDPSTPKTEPKLGQYQQSPKVPFGDSPTIKVKKENNSSSKTKSTSAFLQYLKKKRKGLKRKYRNDQKVVSEASKTWVTMSADEKEKYHRMAKENDFTKGKRNENLKNDEASDPKKDVKITAEWCEYLYKGLLNRGNDCWLNTLLQCINHLTVRNTILACANKNISPLVSALIKVMRKMEWSKSIPIYPDELHSVFQRQCHYIPHTQNDIHESFVHFFASEGLYDDIMKVLFEHEIQYTKICQKCQKRESIAAEKLTTTFIPLNEGVTDVSDSIYKSYSESTLQSPCDTCEEHTEHTRIATLLSLPDVLLVMFKRFEHIGTRTNKLHSKVQLQKSITLITDEPCRYDLRACALHHGENLNDGHYTSLLFQDDSAVEIDDIRVKCVTEEWENRASSTIYLAFYCKNQICTFATQDLAAEHIKISESNTNNVNSRIIKCHNPKSLNYMTERNKSEESNVSSARQISIIDETNKKLEQIWSVAMKNSKICTVNEQGYDLRGIDFKSLQISAKGNNSYQREKPGWLNDNIIDAYTKLLTKSAAEKGKRVFAFSCLFYCSLKEAVEFQQMEKLYRIATQYFKNHIFESYDFIVFPVNIGDMHWCVIVVDMWNQKIFYYDPLKTGAINESAITNITFFLTIFSTARNRLVEFDSKRFVTDFTICWESEFPLQTDDTSCGVFILMYVGTKLGLIGITRTRRDIENIRTIIAYELLQNCIVGDESETNARRSCKVMSLLRQENGSNAILHCMTVGGWPERFEWLKNTKIVFTNQTPKFKMTESMIGKYICKLYYNDGDVIQSLSCKVECTPERDTNFNVDTVRNIFDESFIRHKKYLRK